MLVVNISKVVIKLISWLLKNVDTNNNNNTTPSGKRMKMSRILDKENPINQNSDNANTVL